LPKNNSDTDRLLEHNHNWDGSYRSSYYVTGFHFDKWQKRYETKKYCTECNVSWETYSHLGKASAVDYYEREAKRAQESLDRGYRVQRSRQWVKDYNRTAARAKLINDCKSVKIAGWYKQPKSDD